MTVAEVEKILKSFERAGLLYRWTDGKTGSVCGYWTNIDRRLPGLALRWRMKQGPIPKPDELRQYLQQNNICEETTENLFKKKPEMKEALTRLSAPPTTGLAARARASRELEQ
jgi:hypothetical protein